MTAINAIAEKNAAYLLTDTASYDLTGRVVGFHSKAIPWPHIGCALAITGAGAIGQRIERLLKLSNSFEDLLERAPRNLEYAVDCGDFEGLGGDAKSGDNFRVLIAGWSPERNRGEVYGISSMDEPDGSAFTLLSKEIVLTPGPAASDLRDVGLLTPSNKLDMPDAVKGLLQIIDIQRRNPYPVADDPNTVKHIVGGAAVLTKIDASGIIQTVLRRWPDELGKKIDPARPRSAADGRAADRSLPERSPPPSNVTPLNRQQRRAMERARR